MNISVSAPVSDLSYAWEAIDRLREDGIEEMLVRHWQEVGVSKEALPLALDWERMYAMEARGEFKAMSARNDGALVGYNSFIVARSLHYRTILGAQNDAIYISPKERGEAGLRLILEAEKALRALGVGRIMYHSKVDVILGRGVGDSLDFHEFGFIAEDYGIEIAKPKITARGTLGDVLDMLGYRKIETVHDKVF